MRIAHVSDYYLPRLGGIEMQMHDLAARQRQRGHDVTIMTPTPENFGRGTSGPDPGWVERVDPPISQQAIRPVVAGLIASPILRSERFDIVHVHASLISPFAMIAARAASSAGVPTVVTVHSLWSHTRPAPDIAWRLVGLRRWPVIWSAVSQTAARHVSRTLGDEAAVAVLPNGIDLNAWQTVPVARPPNTVTIASVMRLARLKRPMPLLHILARLRGRISPSIALHAVIIGDGPLRPKMVNYLKDHDMDSWIALPGRLERDDIRTIFSRCDLYVAPAELESFGIAALEARAAGLPVIASSLGGVGEFISDGDEGFLTSDDDEMLHSLTALICDRRTRERIAAHNRAVPPSVSWSIVLDRCEELYAAAQHRAIDAHPRARRVRRHGSA